MVDAEIEAVEHQEAADRQQSARHPGRRAQHRGDRRCHHERRADIVGGALLEAEMAGDVAAYVLEGERGADGGRHGDREKQRGPRALASGIGIHGCCHRSWSVRLAVIRGRI